MTYKTALLALSTALLALAPAFSAKAEDKLSLGVGYYDINDNEGAADFRLEYRWDDPLVWVVKPWVGTEATSDGSVLALGGVLLDMTLDDSWVLTPSFGVGLFGRGNGKDLGNTIEFRSQLELGYTLENQSRIGLAGGHISNAGLGDSNPGTEIVGLYYHMPASWIFGGKSSKTASAYDYNGTAPAAGTPAPAAPVTYYNGDSSGYGSEHSGY